MQGLEEVEGGEARAASSRDPLVNLEPSEVARVFEDRLAEALLGEREGGILMKFESCRLCVP